MAKVLINDTTLSSIATAIRNKNGLQDRYKPGDMPQAIMSLEVGGGGGGDLPEEAFTLTGDCSYRFAYNGWNWFAEQYGNRVTTQEITNCAYMFYGSDALSNIPFDINIKPNTTGITNLNNMFYECNKLTNIPKINFTTPLDAATSTSSGAVNLKNMFFDCWNIKEIDYDIFNNIFTEKYAEEALLHGGANFARAYMFEGCLRLREHPDLSRVMTGATGNNNLYYYMFNSCDSLDEIINLPIHPSNTTTSNLFNYSFSNCQRLKRLIFATQADGTPYTRTWKNQTIDLTKNTGHGMGTNNGIGFGLDKWVHDEETYQELKDNPDYWARSADYSRYNKASAIETISTLPDVSSGSGNTIKFTGAAGANTDGGAINTMTQEEIAVATAKGWTVSFV